MKKITILIITAIALLCGAGFAWEAPYALDNQVSGMMLVNTSYVGTFGSARASSNTFLLAPMRPTWLILGVNSSLGMRVWMQRANAMTSNETITYTSNSVKNGTLLTNFNLYNSRTNLFGCPIFRITGLDPTHNARTNQTLGSWYVQNGDQFLPTRVLLKSNKKYFIRIVNEYTKNPVSANYGYSRNSTNFTTGVSNTAQQYGLNFYTFPK